MSFTFPRREAGGACHDAAEAPIGRENFRSLTGAGAALHTVEHDRGFSGHEGRAEAKLKLQNEPVRIRRAVEEAEHFRGRL